MAKCQGKTLATFYYIDAKCRVADAVGLDEKLQCVREGIGRFDGPPQQGCGLDCGVGARRAAYYCQSWLLLSEGGPLGQRLLHETG